MVYWVYGTCHPEWGMQMKRITSVLLCGLVLAWAGAAVAAEAKVEDETLPRPLKGQTPDYYTALARVHAAFGHFKTAETLQLKAFDIETDRAKKEKLSFELVDRIYMRARWWDKAAAELLRTIRLVDKDDVAHLRKYHMDRALALGEGGKADEQIRELAIIVKLSRDDDQREWSLRRLHSALGRFGKLQAKVNEYEATVRKDPKDTATLRLLAEIYDGSGLLKLPGKAIRKYQQILKADPADVDAGERLTRLYVDTGQPDKALAMYERLMALNPKRFDMYLADAISQMPGEKNEKKVLAWAKKILEKYPDKSTVPLRIANLHSSRRRHAAAAEYYRKAVDLIGTHPSKLSIYFRLIESQIAAEKYADAEQTCGEAAKLQITSSSLRKRVANLLKKARDLQGKPAGE